MRFTDVGWTRQATPGGYDTYADIDGHATLFVNSAITVKQQTSQIDPNAIASGIGGFRIIGYSQNVMIGIR